MVKPKKIRKRATSGVTIRQNKDGSFVARSYGPNPPDLRDVLPGIFGTSDTIKRGTR